jgi:hypothetical protein
MAGSAVSAALRAVLDGLVDQRSKMSAAILRTSVISARSAMNTPMGATGVAATHHNPRPGA